MATHYDDRSKMRSNYPMTDYYPPPAPAVGYPGYPNAPRGYPYAVAPPAGYYVNGYTATPYDSGAYSLVRRVLIGITAGVVMMGMFLFVVWFIYRPRDPVFKINSLSVSNFTIADSKLDAVWDLSFSIWNPNTKLDMQCNELDVLMFYKKNLLTTTSVSPFLLEKMNGTTMQDHFLTSQDLVDDDMEDDRKFGFMVFSVRMRLSASFQNGGEVTKDHKMAILCENLRIYFDGDTGNGKSAPGPWACLLYEY
ncbi:hypothetical protein NE237_004744 [Protea cynaroides]|uniref:Late embryogenesis abundant protein LEA-2 subgroup domain-containing protein n=1 Tax=Protea cynaroides TaxID=273540 RepID=A0A9Q0KJJ2_9MAGN|nr:hypothetical protein NE237_004744 [Protea cynaroides]